MTAEPSTPKAPRPNYSLHPAEYLPDRKNCHIFGAHDAGWPLPCKVCKRQLTGFPPECRGESEQIAESLQLSESDLPMTSDSPLSCHACSLAGCVSAEPTISAPHDAASPGSAILRCQLIPTLHAWFLPLTTDVNVPGGQSLWPCFSQPLIRRCDCEDDAKMPSENS
jgi:hypothetical protein